MRILPTCIFAACAAALRTRRGTPAVFSLLSITLFPLGRAARVKVSDAFHLPPGCHCGREGIGCHPVGAQCRLQHLSVGRDDSARQTGPGHDLGAPNAASTPVGARIARPYACTRPERRLHENGERKPCIASSPASRGQAQNRTAATLSQIKFFHSMWTNLFAVAGTRAHPPAGVIRKRGRSAPSCVPAAHSREYAVMNQQHGKSASAAQMRVNEPLLVCARPRRRTIPWARNARPYEG